MIRGHAPALRGGLQRVVVLGEGPLQAAVKNIACRHPEGTFQVDGGLGLDAWPAVRICGHHIGDRLGKNGTQRSKHRLLKLFGAGAEPVRCMQAKTVSVCAPEARSSGDKMLGSARE